VLLELRIAAIQPRVVELLRGLAIDLVVGDEDAAPAAAIRPVEQRRGVQRRARSREEVKDQCVWAVLDDRLEAVLDRVERLRERERVAAPEQVRDQRRPVGPGIVRRPPPEVEAVAWVDEVMAWVTAQ
jgi:hypothetical protein